MQQVSFSYCYMHLPEITPDFLCCTMFAVHQFLSVSDWEMCSLHSVLKDFYNEIQKAKSILETDLNLP